MTTPGSVYEPNAELVAEILANIGVILSRARHYPFKSSLFEWEKRDKQLKELFVGDFCAYYRFIYDNGADAARITETRLVLSKINQVLVAALATDSSIEVSRLTNILMYVLVGTDIDSSLPVLRQGALSYFHCEQPRKPSWFGLLARYESIGRIPFFRAVDVTP